MRTTKLKDMEKICRLVRSWILRMTTEAGSGHPTSSLSAVELMVGLMFGGFFRYRLMEPGFAGNDRLIFSKGHASPLFYSLWAAAKESPLSEEELLTTYRKFQSHLEGHPTSRFPYTETATGSLGQGLSIGLGMALAGKHIHPARGGGASPEGISSGTQGGYRTFVLLGDSEMAEGSVWEAVQLAKCYKLDNLIGIIDVNRLGQRGETMSGHDVVAYKRRLKAFGWQTYTVDGHNLEQILDVYKAAMRVEKKPVMIIAKTIKGKGVSFLENKNGWHGKALSKKELDKALKELGRVDEEVRGVILKPDSVVISNGAKRSEKSLRNQGSASAAQRDLSRAASQGARDDNMWKPGDLVATRAAYGEALKMLAGKYPDMVVLDGEVSNSTKAEAMKKVAPERFYEMFIAEQNMVGTALGMSLRGKIPMVSTFAAFFTRAFDQIRMCQYSDANIKFAGSHAGVSIGEDGASQMGLEDLAMFRSLHDSVVLYPSDSVSTVKLVEAAVEHKGIVYVRTTRGKTPVIYDQDLGFRIGGCRVLRESKEDQITIVAAGITLHEALKAHKELKQLKIPARVIDLYSIKPLDVETLRKAAEETKAIITVEDHYQEGGIGEAVSSALLTTEEPKNEKTKKRNAVKFLSLAVRKLPMSGKPEELLAYEEIDAEAIVEKVKEIL